MSARVLATYNIKGGVGKTSAAVNLAYLAARDGHPALLWDLDPQGASTYLFRIRPRLKGGARELVALRSQVGQLIKGTDHEHLDLLPADFSLRHLDLDLDAFKRPALRLAKVIEPMRAEYDYIFLDCAPSISLVSESVFEAADALLVPVIPAALSSRTFEQLEELAGRSADGQADGRPGAQVLAFFSMVEVNRPMHRSVMARMRSAHHVTMLGAGVPDSEDVERMGEERDPVGAFAPASPAAMAYEAPWLDIQRRLRAAHR